VRLFHFSERAGIAAFQPRPVAAPSERGPGRGWLNGPLVWAIDEPHQPMYLFPRDCPRILVWPLADSTQDDRAALWGDSRARMLAFVETGWLARISTGRLWRYELRSEGFESLDDAGMWVSRQAATPVDALEITDLPTALAETGAELRALPSLLPLRPVWNSSLHVSGIRLRNALGWPSTTAI